MFKCRGIFLVGILSVISLTTRFKNDHYLPRGLVTLHHEVFRDIRLIEFSGSSDAVPSSPPRRSL